MVLTSFKIGFCFISPNLGARLESLAWVKLLLTLILVSSFVTFTVGLVITD